MAKKIFIVSSIASGNGYAVKFTANWARTNGSVKVHTFGTVRVARKIHKLEETAWTKFTANLDNNVFNKHNDKFGNIVNGWKVAFFLDQLYAKYGNQAAFVFIRHAPVTAELYAKKVKNKLNMRMNNPLSVEEILDIGGILNRKIDAFMQKHNISWVTVGEEPIGSGLTLESGAPTDKWLEMSMLKGPGF